jgi:predicted amino acid-binding ACT domain protein
MKIAEHTYLVTAILPDRVGILRDVTGAVFNSGGNLTDLRQMIVGGVFLVSCVAQFVEKDFPVPDKLRETIIKSLPEKDAVVSVIPYASSFDTDVPVKGERYVASVSGPDRPGRVHLIAATFAANGVNVEDWRHDLSDSNHALTIGIVRIPPECDVAKLKKELAEKLSPFNLAANLCHENIFKATNEVGPISSLLGRDIEVEAEHA